ncbi:unnamed protein product [Clonostachys solani]|uniref:Uncharacterized protein n=1 Tax=Clonostachys solani TaxID=160281 RepID=A0A9N9Z1N8_9HYPO|nr:unnamed protein product [Clonostachys solani]
MSTEKYDETLAKLTKAMADLKEKTVDCKQTLEETETMFDEASAAKVESLKASNEFIKGQRDELLEGEGKVQKAFVASACFKTKKHALGDKRDEELEEYRGRQVSLGREIRENDAMIKSLEERPQDQDKSGGSEAK